MERETEESFSVLSADHCQVEYRSIGWVVKLDLAFGTHTGYLAVVGTF